MSVVSGVMGAQATEAAAQTQADATAQAAAVQQRMYNETVGRMDPYYQQGLKYQENLAGMMPRLTKQYDLAAYQASPEYANQVLAAQQARDAMSAQGAASGMYGGGTWGTEMQRRASEIAQQGYGQGLQDYWGQNMNIYGMYQPLVASGQNAAANLAAQGAAVANQLSNIYQQGAAKEGAYQSLAGQQMGQGIGTTAGQLGQGLWNYLNQPSGPSYSSAFLNSISPAAAPSLGAAAPAATTSYTSMADQLMNLKYGG